MRAYANPAGSDAERNRLIADHAAMATRIARRVARGTPDWVSSDDLVSAAMVGLAEAADRFDPVRGEPFVAFAAKRIRGAVLDELRRGDLLPRRVRTAARQVGQTMRKLEQTLGRAPEDAEVAAELGVSVEEYQEELALLSHVSLVSFEGLDSEPVDGAAASPSASIEREQMLAQLKQGLTQLPARDAQILALYYNEEFTYAEIGKLLGITESRVCQLHARALMRLRGHVEGAS